MQGVDKFEIPLYTRHKRNDKDTVDHYILLRKLQYYGIRLVLNGLLLTKIIELKSVI